MPTRSSATAASSARATCRSMSANHSPASSRSSNGAPPCRASCLARSATTACTAAMRLSSASISKIARGILPPVAEGHQGSAVARGSGAVPDRARARRMAPGLQYSHQRARFAPGSSIFSAGTIVARVIAGEGLMTRWIVTAAVLGCAAQLQAQTPQAVASPMYMNAEVVKVNASARTLTFRGTGGQAVLLTEGEAVSSLAGLKRGDKVILAYREAPGAAGRRITSIRPTTASLAPAARAVAVPASVPAPAPLARGSFDGSAFSVAATAGQVDRLWVTYRQLCITRDEPVNARGREWFAVLDGSMPRPTDDTCGTNYDAVATAAKDFEAQLDKLRAAAIDAGVLPGDLRETLLRYNIDL